MKNMNLDIPKEIVMMAQWQVWPRILAQIQRGKTLFFEIMIFIADLNGRVALIVPLRPVQARCIY